MQANSNVTISPPSPAPLDRAAVADTAGARWWRAFKGALSADWAEKRRDWRSKLIIGLGVVIAALAATITAIDVHETMADRAVAQQIEHERWSSQGKKNAHSAAHYGVYVFKPLSALSAVDPGIERYVGSTVWLEAHKQNEFIYRPANDRLGSSRQLPLTPTFVLQVIAPLAMIFLGFGVFAGERERGTLRALRMTAAPLTAVGAARALMLWLLALALAVPACIGVAAILTSFNFVSPFVDGGLRLALFCMSYLAYLAIWALVVVAVSAIATSMRASLAILVAIWALWTLIVPRVAVELADSAHQLPSAQAFREQLDRSLGEPHDPDEEAKQKAAILAQYKVTDVKQLPVNWAGISMQRGENRGDAIFDAHYGALFAGFNQQSQFINAFGWLSPMVSAGGVASAAAGSDTAHHIEFVREAETHRRMIQRMMNDFITANPDRDGARVDADDALWKTVPVFNYRFPALTTVVGALAGLTSLAAMLLASIFLFAFAMKKLAKGTF